MNRQDNNWQQPLLKHWQHKPAAEARVGDGAVDPVEEADRVGRRGKPALVVVLFGDSGRGSEDEARGACVAALTAKKATPRSAPPTKMYGTKGPGS